MTPQSFYVSSLHVPHIGIMEGHASLARVDQQFDDRILAGTRQARH